MCEAEEIKQKKSEFSCAPYNERWLISYDASSDEKVDSGGSIFQPTFETPVTEGSNNYIFFLKDFNPNLFCLIQY